MLKIGNNEKGMMKLLCKKDYTNKNNNITFFTEGILYEFEYIRDFCIKIYGNTDDGIPTWCEFALDNSGFIGYNGYLDYFYTLDEYRELQLNKII